MPAYYNEIDPYCVQWLRNLIDAGHIPHGIVDSRPIQEVKGEDLDGYDQCHFFAGLGGWAYALRLAGWPEGKQVWTGSCPCQPFSVAGKQRGFGDERDLWPVFSNLIRKRSPSVTFGEQVASSAPWIARMRSDLEEMDYAVGTMPIEAACAGAPQYRDRIWFVADDYIEREGHRGLQRGREFGGTSSGAEDFAGSLASESRIAEREQEYRQQPYPWENPRPNGSGASSGCDKTLQLAHEHNPRLEGIEGEPSHDGAQRSPAERGTVSRLVRDPNHGWGEGWTESEFRSRGFTAAVASLPDGTQFIGCPDGKYRRLPPPRVRWLGNGIPSRVARLRAYGNAIVPQVAAEFIGAYLDTIGVAAVI